MAPRYLTLKAGTHVLMDTSVARYVRRVLDNPRIATYFHLREGCWVIGEVICESGGVFWEHALWHNESDVQMAIEDTIWKRSPSRMDDLKTILNQQSDTQDAALKKYKEEVALEVDVRDYLRRRAGTHLEDHPMWDDMVQDEDLLKEGR